MNQARSIAVLVGSIRRESINRKLAFALARLAPPDWTFVQLRIDDLGLYNPDDANPNPAVVRQVDKFLRTWVERYVAWVQAQLTARATPREAR